MLLNQGCLTCLPYLKTSRSDVNDAFRIAVADLLGNVLPYQGGLLDQAQQVIIAGLDYVTPWTRDAAINSWFAGSLLISDVAHNTLLSVLERECGNKIVIGGEYWDAMIWSMGAWDHYLVTRNRGFLEVAFEAISNTLDQFEEEEFDPDMGLFRGGACFQDGIAGYPDYYSCRGAESGIKDWIKRNSENLPEKGEGLPMFCLSTNCIYYNAYRIAQKMADELDGAANPQREYFSGKLNQAINLQFWDEDLGNYHYMIGPHGDCASQEGLGSSFAILFGVANDAQRMAILGSQHIAPAGIPCVWPGFDRYSEWGNISRHAGTVWPHVQGFWALAALGSGGTDLFDHEFNALTAHANRDAQFAEIYHPSTAEVYGGIQENGEAGMVEWKSCRRQTWSATAYLAMIIRGIAGIEATDEGIKIHPYLPLDMRTVELSNLVIADCRVQLSITGQGSKVSSVLINDQSCENAILTEDHLTKDVCDVSINLS